jgi:hypothetical protein
MTERAIIKTNRAACERTLRNVGRAAAGYSIELIQSYKLQDTPFEVLEALIAAYDEVERTRTESE